MASQQHKDKLAQGNTLAADGHLSAAMKIFLPEAEAGNLEARFRLTDIALERHKALEAVGHARIILDADDTNAKARLRMGEAWLTHGQYDQAQAALPRRACPGEEERLEAALRRARLLSTRREGEQLWASGNFVEGRKLYQRLHAEEEKTRAEFRTILDNDPGNPWAWQVLLDAVGNYRLSYALNQALPLPDKMRRAFFDVVTGRPDHPAQNHHAVAAMIFESLARWPSADVVATLPTPPRVYQPACFGRETQPLITVNTVPRQIVRLHDALAYDAGTYLWLVTPEGRAPWLYEGVWGPYIQSKLPAIMPPPHMFFEGEGLGTTLAVLPAATQRIERPVVLLGYWNNYGHFLHDVLPQLEDAEAVLGRDFYILTVDALLPAIQEAFARAGYGPDRLISIGERRTAILREAYCLTPRTVLERVRRFTTPMLSEFWHFDMALDDAGVDFARRRLSARAAAAPQPTSRKIYTSRRNTIRSPHNESQLEAMLAAQGFEIVIPDRMTLAEQIDMFSATRLLVALEGASLANMMFMPPGTDVVVLRSLAWNWSVNCFDELARMRGLNLHIVDFAGREVPLDLVQDKLQDQAFSATT